MPNHFCPQCGLPLTKENVCWRVTFPREIIDAATEPFRLDWLNELFGSAEVRSAGQAILEPEAWSAMLTFISDTIGTDLNYIPTDTSTGILRTYRFDHEPVRLDLHACCPHCGQPRGDTPGSDLPPRFFDFEKVIGVAVAGAADWGKTCLLLGMLMYDCRALNRQSALNPLLDGISQPRFEFTAPRLSDSIQNLLQQLEFSPHRCPQGTRMLEPVPLEMLDRSNEKRYLILLYDTAGEFYRNNEEAQLRFLEYAAGMIYLIDPRQTTLQPTHGRAEGHSLRPADAAAQIAMQADPSERVNPSQWRQHDAEVPTEPIGKLLRDLCGLNGTQNLLPQSRKQHIAYVLGKTDRFYLHKPGPFWEVCGILALLPENAGVSAGAYYMRGEVNEQLFQKGNCAIHRTFQVYLPHYSLHTVSALGSEPVEDAQSHIYHLRCAPAPHLVEEPLLAVIRYALK